jgi:hypothetical protein
MIRNRSLKQLFKSETGWVLKEQLKELCFGRGFTLIDGKQHPLGMCAPGSKFKYDHVV